jgi:hypothetical protein
VKEGYDVRRQNHRADRDLARELRNDRLTAADEGRVKGISGTVLEFARAAWLLGPCRRPRAVCTTWSR